MISIIIPAYNEASVIGRCCEAIIKGADPDEMEVIVVCNGCTDNTAETARAIDTRIKVIKTDIPSKSNALNLGDRHATGFPRFFIDADVLVPLDSIRKTAAVLKKDGVLAAAPMMNVDCTDRSWFVKAFYDVWLRLPYCRNGMIGSGIYALSKGGRERFEKFPSITADDGYVRSLFLPGERVTVESCTFTIYPPKTLHGIVHIKTRAHYGSLELFHEFPELLSHDDIDHKKALIELSLKPRWWGPLVIYLYVRVFSRIKARYRFRRGIRDRWERDNTSR